MDHCIILIAIFIAFIKAIGVIYFTKGIICSVFVYIHNAVYRGLV